MVYTDGLTEVPVADIPTTDRCHTCGATDKELDDSWGPFCSPECRKIAEDDRDRTEDSYFM